MANNQNTFIQLPMDVTNPTELRRFLDKLVQQVDVAFGNRGPGSFATSLSLAEVINILNEHEERLDLLEPEVLQLIADVQTLKDGELIVKTTSDTILGNSTETLLCDCSSNDIIVTLPNPSEVLSSGSRSKTISISKVDNSKNIVTINPHNSETIAGEATVDLVASSEVINLVTDGINWYLGV